MDDQWLSNFRFRFVTLWTSARRNYGENTTNRAESEHHALKSHLRNRRATLDQLVGFIEQAQKLQLGELKEKLATSRIKTMSHHAKIRLFDRIRGRVSIKCRDLLYKEINRLHTVLKVHNLSCGHQLYTGCGIPCACRLEKMLDIPDYVMPLEYINLFWRKLDYEKPAYLGKVDDFLRDEGLDPFKEDSKENANTQPKHAQKNAFDKLKNFWNKTTRKPQDKLRGRVSIKCMDQLYKEINMLHTVLKVHNLSCGHQLYTGCGIPCACRLEKMLDIPDYVMPLEYIDLFWRKLDYEKPAYPGKVDDFLRDEGLDPFKEYSKENANTQPKHPQKSAFDKLKNFWNKTTRKPQYKEPEVKLKTRGRPTTKAKEARDEQRSQEQARHSSYTGPTKSNMESARYSSYVGSQETVDLGQSS
ncbi:hypothetical protein SSX86_031194 [Deinandra increscens subsp. villosa]|uniref:Protein FAR1-RELATED SEQUENCE n=1 Tax=Deinandra increscens subsp. villosa TaxID=3103831 RepID=A0AAP0CAD3_9ASTR